ncbi:MAG TPA: dihydroorotase [Candidatus Dorea intestinavium]|nr:dihydroorotase [Candidatus Dorea intestinavium]
MKTLIKGGRLLNPATNTDAIKDILVNNEIIEAIADTIDSSLADRVIDASDSYVMPGLIDLHVHLRDPGLTYKEDLMSGSRAAINGGFTTITAMANTLPVIDNIETFKQQMKRINDIKDIQIIQLASVTKNMAGEELTPISELCGEGLIGISEDGKTVDNSQLYKEGLIEAAKNNITVFDHCEDTRLKNAGVMHLGKISEKLGLPGNPPSAEDTIIARDIILAKETGAKLHLCHLSTKDSVAMLRVAKKAGLPITAEVCPHHFSLADEDIPADHGYYKMAPPLRSKEDRKALLEGLADGTIDAIATDHAPHSLKEKDCSMLKAAFGIVGLETAVPLTITKLVRPGIISPLMMAEKMSYNPAKILGIKKGDLSVGRDADITIIDPNVSYQIEKENFFTKGRNTPFDKMEVYGKVTHCFYKGQDHLKITRD